MDQGSGISEALERRLSGLGAGPTVPATMDRAVLGAASGALARRRMMGGWVGGWRSVAAAAVVGVVAGVVVISLNSGRKVDMVDALRAAKGGAGAGEVRKISEAAVAVRPARGGGL
jgi:hypothetical protein